MKQILAGQILTGCQGVSKRTVTVGFTSGLAQYVWSLEFALFLARVAGIIFALSFQVFQEGGLKCQKGICQLVIDLRLSGPLPLLAPPSFPVPAAPRPRGPCPGPGPLDPLPRAAGSRRLSPRPLDGNCGTHSAHHVWIWSLGILEFVKAIIIVP